MSGQPGGNVDPRIAAALTRADELGSANAQEHVAIYEDVHETLQQVLAEAGAAPDPAGERPPDDTAAAAGDSAAAPESAPDEDPAT